MANLVHVCVLTISILTSSSSTYFSLPNLPASPFNLPNPSFPRWFSSLNHKEKEASFSGKCISSRYDWNFMENETWGWKEMALLVSDTMEWYLQAINEVNGLTHKITPSRMPFMLGKKRGGEIIVARTLQCLLYARQCWLLCVIDSWGPKICPMN